MQAFASCGGQYAGTEKANRAKAAASTLERGYRSIKELQEIVADNCGTTLIIAEQMDASTEAEYEDNLYIEAFASCNGRYQGETKDRRYQTTKAALDRGEQTLDDLREIIDRGCPGAVAAAARTPAATPTTTPSNGKPTPVPTIVWTRAPTATPQPTRTPGITRFYDFQLAVSLRHDDPALARRMESIGWVRDGLDETEEDIVAYLLYLCYDNHRGHVSDLIEMPFLESPDAGDAKAMEALWTISFRAPQKFRAIMAHPTVTRGIDENWKTVITALESAANHDLSLIGAMLDTKRVSVERRTIRLPLAGRVELAIVRTKPAVPRSMDLLEHAVRSAETFMATEFPDRDVILLFEDAVTGDYAGVHVGSHIAVKAQYDVDDESYEAQFTPFAIGHEVAHYYWTRNENWIDEGISDLMASTAEHERTGAPIEVTNHPCVQFDTIAELEERNPRQADASFRCNYSLGERLFVEISNELGSHNMSRAIRRLYKMSVEEDEGSVLGSGVGIGEVRQIFGTSEETKTIVRRWYDGTERYDKSGIDQSKSTWRIPSINGKVEKAGLTLAKDGPVVPKFSAKDHGDAAYVMLEYSHNVRGGPYEQPLTLVAYYEDGHPFVRRQVTVKADEKGNITGWIWWFSIGRVVDWKPGDYWIMLYDGDEKSAGIRWTVTP